MALRIAGKSFRVVKATLGGTLFHPSWKKFDPTIGDGVQYSLEVTCESKRVTIDGVQADWSPQLSFDRFALDTDFWPAIESLAVVDWEGSACLEFQEDATAAAIEFGKRTGSRFRTRIVGEIRGIKFEFHGPMNFIGYRVVGTARDTEQKLSAMLEEHIQLTGLVAHDSELNEFIPKKKMRAKLFVPARRVSRPA